MLIDTLQVTVFDNQDKVFTSSCAYIMPCAQLPVHGAAAELVSMQAVALCIVDGHMLFQQDCKHREWIEEPKVMVHGCRLVEVEWWSTQSRTYLMRSQLGGEAF